MIFVNANVVNFRCANRASAKANDLIKNGEAKLAEMKFIKVWIYAIWLTNDKFLDLHLRHLS